MKAKVTLLALTLLASAVAFAQPPAGADRGPNMDRLALLLDLDAYQKTEVEKILKEQHEHMLAAREEARSSGQKLSAEERRARHEQFRQELQTKLSGVLNETQMKKFAALHEGRGPGRPHRGGDHMKTKPESAPKTN